MTAENEEQAWAEWDRATGLTHEEVDNEIKQEPDDKVLSCKVDSDGDPTDGDGDDVHDAEKTAGEWAYFLGVGFAFSENY